MSTPITDKTCERILGWIQVSAEGAHSSTKLDNLSVSAAAAFAATATSGSQHTRLEDLRNHAGFLSDDWRNLLTIILKLEWMVGRVQQGEPKKLSRWMHRCAATIGLEPKRSIEWSLWMHFAKSDIDMFLIELRSAFDYLAEIVGCIALSPCPRRRSSSYSTLTEWCEQSADAEQILGSDLRDLVGRRASSQR